ncbi:MAG: hypothetical protein CMQ05_13970 [Gammaproteobacteria bacterium]|nr:hypothetical protein [Gammaproteobacteria bacterium]RPG26928.1 MAG: hypothetical protein CBC10_002615 [Gammaproteobacteria bacterium TMED50]
MAYAHRPRIFDADTHMMERPDWIAGFADPGIRDRLMPFGGPNNKDGLRFVEDAIARFDQRCSDAAIAEKAEADFLSMKQKGWHGMGAFDAAERKRVNDLLGFNAYIVFPTEAFNQVIATKEPEVFVGGVRALNRGLEAFCSEDPRMMGTAYVPFGTGPEQASQLLEEAITAGFRVLLIDTVAPEGALSFTHPDYDPLWARIQDAELSCVLHIGAQGGPYRAVPKSFLNNAREETRGGNGEGPSHVLGYMGMPYNAELFLSAMIFDGVLERFPRLRIAAVELGASWIISWMKQMDQAFRAFRKRQDLSHLELLPSDYALRQVWITAFAGEDVGWLLEHGAGTQLMFSSDYPHHEGTDDPIKRFERTMSDTSEQLKHQFYTSNFERFLGPEFALT